MIWFSCHCHLIGSTKSIYRKLDRISNHFKLKSWLQEQTEPFVNPWHPDAIPPIDPRNPCIVNPSGEFGPESYLDTGAYFPAKYPDFKESSKQNKKKQDENGKKKKPSLKLDFGKIKKGTTQTRLDRWLFKPKAHARVRFNDRVVLKEITLRTESWTTMPLKGFSNPHSSFAKKRLKVKCHMTPKNARKVTHTLVMREKPSSDTNILPIFHTDSSPAIHGGSMALVGLDKFKNNTVLTEVPPVTDKKG